MATTVTIPRTLTLRHGLEGFLHAAVVPAVYVHVVHSARLKTQGKVTLFYPGAIIHKYLGTNKYFTIST